MKLLLRCLLPLLVWLPVLSGSASSFAAGAGGSTPLEGFVETNGVRLQYLDWGGSGDALILIPGLGDNPHVFDDLAPAFTGRFRVIAYARRGSGGSDVKGPYDVTTLTADLRGVMDALKIEKADLVGYSAAGGEVTQFAIDSPARVHRLVYFEGGYDVADPDFSPALSAMPQGFFDPPTSAMVSLDAFREYLRVTQYTDVDDMNRIEANLREKVIIQADGSLKYRTPKEVIGALYAALMSDKRRDYRRIRCPVLAIYSDHLYNLRIPDATRRDALVAFEKQYWHPFQAQSMNRVRKEIKNAQVVQVTGTHDAFFLTDRERVVASMRRFLDPSVPVNVATTR